jgi:hypothetical protein
MKALVICCLLLSFMPSLAAQKDKPSSPGITYENYLLLKNGMKYPVVVKILGKDGVEVSRGEAGLLIKQKVVTYRWENETGSKRIVVIFLNGKLTSKAQKGLE